MGWDIIEFDMIEDIDCILKNNSIEKFRIDGKLICHNQLKKM